MQMDDFLMDEDSLTKVVAVSYSDNYPNYYNILTARSESHVYFYTADNVDYLGDKSTYSNIESYLKVDKTDLNGVVNLYKETITLDEINTSIPKTKLIVSKDDVDNKHISGFYLDNDNKFHVYQRKEGLDSFNDNNSDQIIEQGQPLFEYYQGLNNSI